MKPNWLCVTSHDISDNFGHIRVASDEHMSLLGLLRQITFPSKGKKKYAASFWWLRRTSCNTKLTEVTKKLAYRLLLYYLSPKLTEPNTPEVIWSS